ncbi:MAG: spore maturation protein [Candidatus Sumerlaeia bacterium]|nr:spore maturation protein [Candidatus Sumerlaeia bacterium]
MFNEIAAILQIVITTVSDWAVPLIILGIPIIGFIKGVKVYEVFVEGAKEGFDVAVKIMPYLVAILVAIGMLRDVQFIEFFGALVGPITDLFRMPPEILPMALIRPLSGGGATGIMVSIFAEHGPDSYIGLMASVMMGSTETTFYVLAVYFGSVNIRKTRHALPAGLFADVVGIITAVVLCAIVFGDLYGQ